MNRVIHFRAWCAAWLPVILCMALIFGASADVNSFGRSWRLIDPVIRWLFPHVSRENIHHAVVVARKCAHVTEYALLACLVFRALEKTKSNGSLYWNRRIAFQVLLFVLIYATLDELHQHFVPGREGKGMDVLIDTAGGIAALGALRLFTLSSAKA